MLTEFGGIALKPRHRAARGTARDRGYSLAATPQDFARQFTALVEAVISTPLFSGFCHPQFADSFQEANGLLSADRRPKIPLKHIAKAVTRRRSNIQGVV